MGVGLYLTCTPEGCQHIASTSKANIIVVENDSQLEKVLEVSRLLFIDILLYSVYYQIKDKLPHLKAIIHYSDLLVRSTEENLFHVSMHFEKFLLYLPTRLIIPASGTI